MKSTYMSAEIPPHMLRNLAGYVERHEPVGGFLQAVLENDLKEACGRADSGNLHILWAYVAYLYNEAPSACWGSPAKVAAWLELRNNQGE